MSKEEPKFWGLEGESVLSCTSIQERLQEYVDGLYPDDKIPETIELFGFDPMYVLGEEEIERLSDFILDEVLEHLDENYSTAAEDPTDPSDKMKEAAKAFATVIISEYIPFDCHEVCRKTVRINDYLDESDMEK